MSLTFPVEYSDFVWAEQLQDEPQKIEGDGSDLPNDQRFVVEKQGGSPCLKHRIQTALKLKGGEPSAPKAPETTWSYQFTDKFSLNPPSLDRTKDMVRNFVIDVMSQRHGAPSTKFDTKHAKPITCIPSARKPLEAAADTMAGRADAAFRTNRQPLHFRVLTCYKEHPPSGFQQGPCRTLINVTIIPFFSDGPEHVKFSRFFYSHREILPPLAGYTDQVEKDYGDDDIDFATASFVVLPSTVPTSPQTSTAPLPVLPETTTTTTEVEQPKD